MLYDSTNLALSVTTDAKTIDEAARTILAATAAAGHNKTHLMALWNLGPLVNIGPSRRCVIAVRCWLIVPGADPLRRWAGMGAAGWIAPASSTVVSLAAHTHSAPTGCSWWWCGPSSTRPRCRSTDRPAPPDVAFSATSLRRCRCRRLVE